jgi:hypothetical protein
LCGGYAPHKPVVRYEYAANYRDLRGTSLHEDENDQVKRRLQVFCSGGRQCATADRLRVSDIDLIFCDEQTAKNALLAINILIRASRNPP